MIRILPGSRDRKKDAAGRGGGGHFSEQYLGQYKASLKFINELVLCLIMFIGFKKLKIKDNFFFIFQN